MADARVVSGWSQAEFAEILRATGLTNMHQNTVSRIEKGDRPLRMAESEAIAKLFGLTVDEMLREDFAPLLTWVTYRGGQWRASVDLVRALVAYVRQQALMVVQEGRLRELVGNERVEKVMAWADAGLDELIGQLIPEIPGMLADTKGVPPMVLEAARLLIDRQMDRNRGAGGELEGIEDDEAFEARLTEATARLREAVAQLRQAQE